MNSASRRIGTYLYSLANASAPSIVRAPQLTMPSGNNAHGVDADRVDLPVLGIGHVEVDAGDAAQMSASVPAGAFHTPRVRVDARVEAGHRAGWPDRDLASVLDDFSRGKYTAL